KGSSPGSPTTMLRAMSTRPYLAAAVLVLLGAACASSGDRATVTAGGSPAAAPTFADTSTTTATLAASSTTTAPAPATATAPVSASSTTTAPAPTTTTIRKPAPSTTTTTFPAGAIRLTIVNQHPSRVQVSINAGSYSLAPGQRLGPMPFVPDPEGHESYSAVV